MELTQKGEMVSRLQAKASQIGKILNNLEKYNHLIAKDTPTKPTIKRYAPSNQIKPLEKPNRLEFSSSSRDQQSESANKKNVTDNTKPVENVQKESTSDNASENATKN